MKINVLNSQLGLLEKQSKPKKMRKEGNKDKSKNWWGRNQKTRSLTNKLKMLVLWKIH